MHHHEGSPSFISVASSSAETETDTGETSASTAGCRQDLCRTGGDLKHPETSPTIGQGHFWSILTDDSPLIVNQCSQCHVGRRLNHQSAASTPGDPGKVLHEELVLIITG